MKIAIVSDSHDHIPRLRAALEDAKARGAEAVVHCGDVVAPSTIGAVLAVGLPIHVIHGNNAGDLFALGKLAVRREGQVSYYGMDGEVELGGKKIFMVHYPHYAEAMCATGNYDLVCCGHSHKPQIEARPNLNGETTMLVNPGTVGGVADVPATYVMGDLDSMQFDVHTLPHPCAEQQAANG